jgi:poly-gamma-glutamate synthesis protein (capsule biosynthesis protein)
MRGALIVVIAAAVVTFLAPAHPAPAAETPRQVTIAAAGDVLIHRRVAQVARHPDGGYDFSPMVAEIEPWISWADLAICHLEGTLGTDEAAFQFYPRFIGPAQVAAALSDAGWDVCSTAGNHSMDAGGAGVDATLDALDAAGVHHDGTARAPWERGPGLYRVGEPAVVVAHMSYTYSTNGLPLPPDRPWAVNPIDADTILLDAAAARESGAEIVVVSLHWGAEGQVTPTPSQRGLAETLLTSGDIDLILGSHVHVVQPVEQIAGRWVVYGMGNHLSNQNSRYGPEYFGTEDGVVVLATATEQPDGSFDIALSFVPTWVLLDDYTIFSTQDALLRGHPASGLIAASQERTVERLGRLGASVPLAPSPWPEVSCFGARATITGTDGPDFLVGTPGDDVIAARGGDDLVLAGDGRDLVCGGAGDDSIAGGRGPGMVDGGPGDDWASGSASSVIIGGAGIDRCVGGFFPAACER